MKPPTFPVSNNDARHIYHKVTQGRDIAKFGDITFYGKTISLSDGSTATKLFERSTASKKFLSIVVPQKLKKEKELAFDVIKQAVTTKFPKIDCDQVMVTLGIRKGESIKLSKLRKFGETIADFNAVANARDIHTGSSASKNRFDQWRLQGTPGLVAITNLSQEDLSLLGKVSATDKVPDILSFQRFVNASLAPTRSNGGSSVREQEAILNFIAGWGRMNENERSSLKSGLSDDGQKAFDAISTLINKMVSVDKLPVNQTGSFGLDRLFARRQKFQDERNSIEGALIRSLDGVSDAATTAAALQKSAIALGQALGDKWCDPAQPPRNYMALESQSKTAIRSFLDQNMQLMLKGIPEAKRSAATAQWQLNKEAFISTMARTASATFIGNKLGEMRNNHITMDNRTFRVDKELGKGGEGMVRLGVTERGDKIAVKSALASTTKSAALEAEIDRHLLVSKVNNKNILRLHGAFRDEDGKLHVAMEFAPHNDLDNIFQRFGPAQRQAFIAEDPKNQEKLQNLDRYVATSLFSGLVALHEGARMLHGDLKAENVFIGEGGVPKLADFGRSVLLEENIVKGSTADVMAQLAPEVAVNLNNYLELTPATDIWSMGIILYKMMTGDPFPIRFTDTPKGSSLIAVQTQLEIFKNNPAMLDAKARAEALNIEKISDKKMADLLVKIFHPDPAKRPTASEALAELKAMAGPTPLNEDEQGKFLIELSQWPTDDSKK